MTRAADAAALALLALAALAGCNVLATGVTVTVDGAGVTADQLRVVATVDGSALPATLVPTPPRALTLPTSFFAELPDSAHSATFEVTALLAGAEVAHGVSPAVAVSAHHQATAAVTLSAAAICGPTAQPTTCNGGELFCDSFEAESGTSFSSWSGLAVSNSGGGAANPGTAIAVQTSAPVCAGSHALHAVSMGATQQAFVFKSGLSFPSPTYLRAFVYLPSATATSASYDLFGFADNNVGQYLQLGYEPAHAKLFFFSNFGSPEVDFPTTLPLDRWFCLEATLRFDAAAGSLALAIDGATLGTQSNLPTQPSGATYDTFDAGLVFATSSAELFLDEIVLSPSPVGCH